MAPTVLTEAADSTHSMVDGSESKASNQFGRWSAFDAIVLAITLILGGIARAIWITDRPLHSDEGVNFHFISEVLRTGYYPYSGENYHGSSYFYLATAMVKLFGDSELALRSVSILSGLALILLVAIFLRQEGRNFVLFSALAISTSPTMVFHSRYAIHEMFLIFSQTLFVFSAYRWAVYQRSKDIYLIAISAALCLSTKETSIICFAAVAVALVAATSVTEIFRRIISSREQLSYAYLLFVVLLIFIFTGAFQSSDALKEFVIAIPQWTGRGVEKDYGHFKPFLYYLDPLLVQTELPTVIILGTLLVLILLSLVPKLRLISKLSLLSESGQQIASQSKQHLPIFLFVWFCLTFLIYSSIRYKTPWLVINISLPALLIVALVFSRLSLSSLRSVRIVSTFAGLLYLSGNIYLMAKFNYQLLPNSAPYGSANPLSYVHTSPGMLQLKTDIQDYWKKSPNSKVLVGVNQYWPLPYYLRNQPTSVGYYKPEVTEEAIPRHDIVIAETSVELDLEIWEKKYYRLSDVQETNSYFRKVPIRQ